MSSGGGGRGKRKRNDRTFSADSSTDAASRPSPHRPSDLALAQRGQYGQPIAHSQAPQYQQGGYGAPHGGQGRGGRRGGRGGRGGSYSNGAHGSYDTNHGPSRGPRADIRGQDDSVNGTPIGRAQNRAPTTTSSTPSLQVPQTETRPSTPGAASTPAPLTPLPPPTPKALPPPKPAGPYDYEILTKERLDTWEDAGRDAILSMITDDHSGDSTPTVITIFQEIVRAGLDGKLDPNEAGHFVGQIIEKVPADRLVDGETLFLDTLSVLTQVDIENPRIQPIVLSTGISPTVLRSQLDDSLLQAVQLVRSTFNKVFIRQQTGILYRQSNYNLLREETEGFSKLLTELFTTTSDEPPTAEVVEDTFENIKALVGAFDLDAGRVLDVILDIFATLLVRHYRFFVKLLRASSWWPQAREHDGLPGCDDLGEGLPTWAEPDHSDWKLTEEERLDVEQKREHRDIAFWQRAQTVGMDAYFELGGRRALTEDDVLEVTKTMKGEDASQKETINWITQTRTFPPLGNTVAAQLLGFKLRFYSSKARDASDALPVNLIYLAALLIKIGFISLRDLYMHLWPEDSDMDKVKEKQQKEKEERELAKRPGGGSLNALARAGALADDTMPAPVARLREADARGSTPSKSDSGTSKAGTPAPKTEEEEKEELPEPSDQKTQLLRSLLCIGAIPEALYLLGRYAWLPDLFPDLPEHLNRILHHSLRKVYADCQPLRDRDSVREATEIPDPKQAGVPKGEFRLQEPTSTKVLRWAHLDKNDVEQGVDYRFYWDDWADNVPVCQSVDDVFTLCSTLLSFSGMKIGQDAALLMKLARIGKHSLAEDFSESNKARWIDLCKRLLCPALSLTRSNPSVVNEVFDILKLFPTQIRFSIYAEWFTGQTSRLPDIEAAFGLAKAETKDVLKRMSKTNMKPMARNLAKISCASPGITFAVVLNQIESYENLIDVVVECGRYFTYMGYDVLIWCIMTTLGRAGRSRVSEDGITTSGWLASLSLFTGKVFKRYSVMSTLPILQYVLEQLRQGNFTDLRVLRELITSMAGIAPDTDFTEAQVQAMAGGELLQAATLRQVHDKRHESKATATRLIRTLTTNGLVGPLLVSIAQQRQMCVFNPDQLSLKVIGENYDDIHIVMTQFLEMIRSNLTIEEFDAAVPDVTSLISEYGIDPSIAFTIHRRSIAKAIDTYDTVHKTTSTKGRRRPSSNKQQPAIDVDMTDAPTPVIADEASEATLETNGVTNDEAQHVGTEITPKTEDVESANERRKSSAIETPWHPVLQDLMGQMQPTMSEKFMSSMSLPFFVTFWQLNLHDLMAPHKSYTDEDKRQKERIAAINADRSDVTAAAARRRDLEKKDIAGFRDRLLGEMKTHMTNYQDVRSRLETEKKFWFKDFKNSYSKLNDALLQDCFLPRLLVSPLDSYFAWKMLNLLHSSGTPEFRTMFFLDRLFGAKMLPNLIFQCTAREAECLGRFLNEVLRELGEWHASKTTFEKRAWGAKKELPGFVRTPADAGQQAVLLDFEDFRQLLYKWHLSLSNALKLCITGGEYMHIKNAIVVLRCVCKHFPVINFMGNQLYNAAEVISKDKAEKDNRPDIWVAANSLLGNLKARQKDWILPQAFYTAKKSQKPQNRDSAARSLPGTPAADNTSTLNATATEFVPKQTSITNGDIKLTDNIKGDVEDGELEDVDKSDTKKVTNGADTAKAETGKASATTPQALESGKNTTSVLPKKVEPVKAGRSTPTPASLPQKPEAVPARATPQPGLLPGRPDLVDSRSSSSRPPSRQQHGSYTRPDTTPQPHTRHSERPGDRASSDQRAPPTLDGNRHGRPTDLLQQKLSERQGRSPNRTDSGRDTRSGTPQSRQRDGHARDQDENRSYSREAHSRDHSRAGDGYGRDTLRSNAAVPAKPTVAPSQVGTQQGAVNPARAALIDRDNASADRGRVDRGQQSGRLEHASREEAYPSGPARNAATNSRAGDTAYSRPSHAQHPSQSDFTPQGPRGRRTSYGSADGYHSQASSQPRPVGPAPRGGSALAQSRIPRHQEENYGRLNADPSSPPRMPSANDVPVNADRRRNIETGAALSKAAQERLPPSGPGAHRQDRFSTTATSSPAAQTQASEVSGMHPSRLNQLHNLQPNASTVSSARGLGSLDTTTAPSGPRSSQGRRQPGQEMSSTANVSISPLSARGPPTGPSAPQDRRNDRRFADLNGTLQQGGQTGSSPVSEQGTSIRGRAFRQDSQVNQQPPRPVAPPAAPSQPATRSRQPLPPQDQITPGSMRPPMSGNQMAMTRDAPSSHREEQRPRDDRIAHGGRDYDSRSREEEGRHRTSRDVTSSSGDVRASRPYDSGRDDRTGSDRDRNGERSERDSRRTRDRSYNEMPPQTSNHTSAPPPFPDPAGSGRELRSRDTDRDRDIRERDGGRDRHRDDGHHRGDGRDRAPLPPPPQPYQQQQPQAPMHGGRVSQLSQEELFAQNMTRGPMSDRRGPVVDSRKRAWPDQGPGGMDDGKRPRRGGGR